MAFQQQRNIRLVGLNILGRQLCRTGRGYGTQAIARRGSAVTKPCQTSLNSFSRLAATQSGILKRGLSTAAPDGFKFLESHEYVKVVDDGVGVVGVSDYAQGQLGDIVFVELPNVGDQVGKGDYLASLESVKAASDIYSPVSGKIVDINKSLIDEPEKVNSGAMSTAWFCKIEMSQPEELKELLDHEAYTKFCANEAENSP